jgi:curved DNA-binding protein CbpA
MDPSKDYYAVLGVLPSIESAPIRAVYLALLKKYHPDVYNGSKDEALQRTKEFNEAYNVLYDEKHRSKYDRLRTKPSDQSGHISRQHKAKTTDYRDPWTAKRRDRRQMTHRLRAIAVGIVGIVALVFILIVFPGSD